MDIIKELKSLNLPIGQYVVFGSGPLSIHGIRESSDVDLFISNELYEKLKNDGWQEKNWDEGGRYLAKDNIEATPTWNYGDYRPTLEEIILISEIIDGIPFAPLSEVIKWKKSYGRPKDLADIELIQNYLVDNNRKK